MGPPFSPKVQKSPTLGRTALMMAAESGRAKVVQCLLKHGASVDRRDRSGCTALWLAVQAVEPGELEWDPAIQRHVQREGGPSPIRLLLSAGAEVNARPGRAYGNPIAATRTTLHWAAERGAVDAVRDLLHAGAELSPMDAQGNTPLTLARTDGRLDVVALLQERGAKK